MPNVTNRPGVTPGTTTGTTGATGATGAQPATGTQPSTASWSPPPLRSANGQVIPTRRVAVDGLAGGAMGATGTVSRFARDAQFDGYDAQGDGAVNRAFIRTDSTGIPGGCRLNVQSFHKQKDDKVTLWLLAEVLDTRTNQLRTVTLSTLAKDETINPGSFRGDLHFDINYADVNAFLQQRNPNLKLNPGQTSLAVAARWSNGHQAGGFGRGGVFRLPPDGAATSVVGVRTHGRGNDNADLPLDMQVAFPPSLTTAVPALKPDGNILSRLESELKGTASKQEMTSAISRMYQLAEAAQRGDRRTVEGVLGQGWTVETVNRYWLQDDGSANQPGSSGSGYFRGFRVDGDGLPIQDPMHDVYMDDQNLGMTSLEGAIRLRTDKSATVVNVKPGGGREDQRTGIRQRVEYGLELKPGTDAAAAGKALQTIAGNNQWAGTVFNQAQREVAALPGNVQLASSLQPWLDVTQDRHKFTVKNPSTGVEIEFSFDKVQTRTLRSQLANPDGSPRTADFYVLEAELDHLQLGSSNASTYAAGNNPNAGHFTTDGQQDSWLSNTSAGVTMDIDPRLHELKDLNNGSFRSTASYRDFEGAAGRVVPWLFPNGLQHGRQKAAHAAEVMGLVHFDDQSLLQAVERVFTDLGYKYTPALAQAFLTGLQSPNTRTKLQQNLRNGNQNHPSNFLRNTIGSQALEFDVPRMKQRVRDRLAALGYQSSPQIEAMFDSMPTRNLQPNNVESYFMQMEKTADAQVMNQWAQALGVSPAPVPTTNINALIGPQTSYGMQLRTKMTAAWVEPSQAVAIEQLLLQAAQNGAQMNEIRAWVRDFNGASTMGQIASRAGHQPMPLRADPKQLIVQAQAYLSPNFLLVDDTTELFLHDVAQRLDLDQAKRFVTNLRNNPQQTVNNQAQQLGLQSPRLKVNLPAVESTLSQHLTNAKVSFTPALKKFVADAMQAGTTVRQLQTAFGRLGSSPDLKAELQAAGAPTGSLQVPAVQYDAVATAGWVTQTLQSYQGAVRSGPALDAFVAGSLAKGLTPQQTVNFARYAVSNGRQYAQRYLGNAVQHDQLPDLPIDVSGMIAHWKTRWTTNMTPEREQYLAQALPAAIKSPTYQLGSDFNRAFDQVLNNIATASGQPRPQGV